MTFQLNANGLPEPGRELDAALWRMLGHKIQRQWWRRQNDEWFYLADIDSLRHHYGEPEAWPDWVKARYGLRYFYEYEGEQREVPPVSTTHAYHQVMEAMLYPYSPFAYEWWVYFDQYDLEVKLVHPCGQEYEAKVKLRQYKGVVEAEAHAVCACVWKAKEGEMT